MNNILATINKNHIAMRPKWHFILLTVFRLLCGTIVLLAIIYLASFVLFVLRETGVLFIPLFGFRGLIAFLLAVPWMLIALSLLLVVVLGALVRHHAFTYRKPLLYSGLGIVALVLLAGAAVERAHLQRKMFMATQKRHMPIATPMYHTFAKARLRNIHRGIITTLLIPPTAGFMMENRTQELLTVVINPYTRMVSTTTFIPRDMVVVFGDRDNNNIIQAMGIRKIGE